MERIPIKIKRWLSIFFCVFLLGVSYLFFYVQPKGIEVSASTVYSGVLEDFAHQDSFSMNEYPVVENDFSLSVFQIGESSAGDMFVYVYQPSGEKKDLRASSINISLDEGQSYHNYRLEFIDSYETIYKYKVIDLTVSETLLRSYEISFIFRPWDRYADAEAEGENETEEVSFSVGQRWYALTNNHSVSYSMEEIEVVEVLDKYVGYLRFSSGFYLFQGSCDSHFVAFSTDHDMDALFEVELDYYITPYSYVANGNLVGFEMVTTENLSSGDPVHVHKTVTHLEKGEYSPYGWIGETYSWDRVRTVEDFISDENNNISDEMLPHFENKQWVVSFDETKYSGFHQGGSTWFSTSSNYSRIEGLVILRLKFEYAGKVYNLGVVDNKVSEGLDQAPDGGKFFPPDFGDWLRKALEILLGLLLIIVGIAVIALFWGPITTLLGLLWKLICMPFKAISNAVKERKNRKK